MHASRTASQATDMPSDGAPVGIVTGAARGLGLALARALDERGWRLVVDARDPNALADATRELQGTVAIAGDLADGEHRRALVEAAGERIDLLVNTRACWGPARSRRWRATSSTRCAACTRSTWSRRWGSSSSPRSSPPSTPPCASTPSIRATCARGCTRRRSQAKTSRTARRRRRACPACSP